MNRAGARGLRRAGAAVALVIALVILQLVVVGMVVAGARDRTITSRRTQGLRAIYAADAAVNIALREHIIGADQDLDGSIGGLSNDGNSLNDPRLLGVAMTVTPSAGGTADETILTARSSSPDAARSAAMVVRRTAVAAGTGGSGLAASYFALGAAPSALASVNFAATPTAVGVVHQLNFANASTAMWGGGPTSRWGARFVGKIVIAQAGSWTLYLNSDDGSGLWINGTQIINNDGLHGMTERSGTVNLAAGEHDFEVRFFNNGGPHGLIASWLGPGVSTKAVIPPSAFRLSSVLSPSTPPVAVVNASSLAGNGGQNQAWLDGFDSGAGPYGGTNIIANRALLSTNATSAGAIALSNRFEVRGNAEVGPSGNPATVITQSGGAAVTGTSSARTTRVGIPRSMLPADFSPASQGNQTITSARTWTGDARYASLTLNGAAAVITVNGNARVQVDGAMTVDNGSRIDLAPGATLSLWVGGNFMVIGNSVGINTGSAPPSSCRIYLTCNSCTIQVDTQPVIKAYIIGERADATMGSGTNDSPDFHGTLHVRSLSSNGKARFHGDLAGPGGVLASPAGGSGAWTYDTLTWAAGP